jgi:hypothetical protein
MSFQSISLSPLLLIYINSAQPSLINSKDRANPNKNPEKKRAKQAIFICKACAKRWKPRKTVLARILQVSKIPEDRPKKCTTVQKTALA